MSEQRPSSFASTFGMSLFIAALGMLFAATLVGYLVIRFRAPEWPPAGFPPLPPLLWLSTFVIIGSSMSIQYALHSIRRGQLAGLRAGLGITWVTALVFLVSQIIAWLPLIDANLKLGKNLYSFTFFMLTGLHGLHVIGGLVPLALATLGTFANRYTATEHTPVKLVTMYWHFLGIAWIVIFICLLATS